MASSPFSQKTNWAESSEPADFVPVFVPWAAVIADDTACTAPFAPVTRKARGLPPG